MSAPSLLSTSSNRAKEADMHVLGSKVEERFCLGVNEDEAIAFFDNLINRSLEAWGPVVIDRLHGLVQGWRT